MSEKPSLLLTTNRNNYVDCHYFGSIYISNKKVIYSQTGLNTKTICFMRSLAKPLQAAIVADYNIIDDYKLKNIDLALFCASHAGSKEHIKNLKKITRKFNIKQQDLELMPDFPLDKRDFKGIRTKLHNNCSGKHLMMILMCKYLGFDYKNYTNENHPIQKLIKDKQTELSGFKSDILTYDGCSTPLWGLPVESVIKAYFNFFHNEKYQTIINSIINNPYLYGGYDRLDSEIIQLSNGKLFSKVGANGFVIVYNFKKDEILLVKLTQNNNPQRRLITLKALNDLGWLNCKFDTWEYNQKKQKVAKYNFHFNF